MEAESQHSTRRVCDACSVRRVKCDGCQPCARCRSTSIDCTRLRPKQKMGPKNIRSGTRSRIKKITTRKSHETAASEQPEEKTKQATSSPEHERVANDLLRLYLDIYRHKMYPVWPVVNVSLLVRRLEMSDSDIEAYTLALSICAATILQMRLTVSERNCLLVPQVAVYEVERIRFLHDHRRNPSLDAVATSFFLHVSYLHLGHRTTSTLLLREAASIAHLLGLHNPAHYLNLTPKQIQAQVRMQWLLFITERYGNE